MRTQTAGQNSHFQHFFVLKSWKNAKNYKFGVHTPRAELGALDLDLKPNYVCRDLNSGPLGFGIGDIYSCSIFTILPVLTSTGLVLFYVLISEATFWTVKYLVRGTTHGVMVGPTKDNGNKGRGMERLAFVLADGFAYLNNRHDSNSGQWRPEWNRLGTTVLVRCGRPVNVLAGCYGAGVTNPKLLLFDWHLNGIWLPGQSVFGTEKEKDGVHRVIGT